MKINQAPLNPLNSTSRMGQISMKKVGLLSGAVNIEETITTPRATNKNYIRIQSPDCSKA